MQVVIWQMGFRELLLHINVATFDSLPRLMEAMLRCLPYRLGTCDGGWCWARRRLKPRIFEIRINGALSVSTVPETVLRGVEVLRQPGKRGLTNEVDLTL